MFCTLALCASVACAPVAAQAQAPSPGPAPTPTSTPTSAPTTATPDAASAIEAGRKAYTSYCTRCHGINLVVSGGAFYDLRTFPRDDKERFLTSVNKGKRAMPAWEGVVSAQDQEAIWVYIGSVNGWSALGR
jgi:mono/diheme cytochrome c family protein